MIFLKLKTKRRLKIFLFLLLFGVTVFTCGYFYLDSCLREITVSEKTEKVPYYSVPQDTTVLFKICEDEILLNLEFENEMVDVIFGEDYYDYGYDVDYTIESDYELVGYLVDLVGGIEIEIRRQTGEQIIEKLKYSEVKYLEKKEITERIIEGIKNAVFTKENLLYIIENSKTDLKFNMCFDWIEYIPKICKFPRYIN